MWSIHAEQVALCEACFDSSTAFIPMLLVLCGSVLAAGLIVSGTPGTAAVLLLVFVLLAGVNSPLVFPRSIGALEAQHRSAVDGRPVVFWRPGCKYCIRPRIRLGRRAGQVHWVDIWRDPVAGAAVRAANDGASERDAVLAQPPSGARAD